jgi:hypothetical protein
MSHPADESQSNDGRIGFERRVRFEIHHAKISSDGGLLLFHALDDVLRLHGLTRPALGRRLYWS